MKKIYFLIIAVAVLISGNLQGQIVSHGTIQTRLTDGTFKLRADEHRGNVQWQFSSDYANWTDLQGKTDNPLLVGPIEQEGWYRAKITEGTCLPVYSDTVSVVFAVPVVVTLPSDSLGAGYAKISGLITDKGGTPVIQRGFYWSKTDTIPDNQSNTVISTRGQDEFHAVLTGLEANTTYYVKAFASNQKGVASGQAVSFKTSSEAMAGSFTDTRDGKSYPWVKIGNQVWMAENLAYLPEVSPSSSGSETIEHYYVYGYQGTNKDTAKASANYSTYGVLYNWPAAMNGAAGSSASPSGVQGVCPAGWHLPSDTEWTRLENYLISNGYNFDGTLTGNKVAKSLAATKLWNTSATVGTPGNDMPSNNSTGFSALPAGTRVINNNFAGIGMSGYGWTATGSDSNNGYGRGWGTNSAQLLRNAYNKAYGFSVRCMRDDSSGGANQPPAVPGSAAPENNATNVSLTPTLTWLSTDPDGDPVTYDLYLDTSSPPAALIAGNLTATSYAITTILKGSTDYFWKVIAKDNQGATTESPVWKFTTTQSDNTIGSFTDTRDGKSYNWVKIGNQIWMAENLAYLPQVSPSSTGSFTEMKYYVYGYNGTDPAAAKVTENFKRYGTLYNWAAAMNGAASSSANPSGVQGVCPAGWYLPSDAEWTALTDYLTNNGYGYQGSGNDIAKSIAGKLYWEESGVPGTPGDDLNSNNSSRFNGMPAGLRHSYGNFVGLNDLTMWWSATSVTQNTAWGRDISYYLSVMQRSHDFIGGKETGASVRCLKKTTNLAPLMPFSPVPVDNTRGVTATPVLSWDCTDPEGDPVTYDLYIGLSETPTTLIASNLTAKSFTITTPLKFGNLHYWRIVARDNQGNSTEGPVWKFTVVLPPITTGTFTDDRDMKNYSWVKIGNQTWMAENLAYLPSVNPPSAGSETVKHYYVYDYNGTSVAAAKATTNYQTYGVLYNWVAAMNDAASSNTNPSGIRGVCPSGWHMPGKDEWQQLEDYLVEYGFNWDGKTTGYKVAKAMAAKTLWNSSTEPGDVGNDKESNNSSGFSGRPAGVRSSGNFAAIGNHTVWWSATEDRQVLTRQLGHEHDFLWLYEQSKDNGYSVRCVKD